MIKTMLNWTLALSLALSLGSLTGCSKDKDKDKGGETPVTTPTDPNNPNATPESELPDSDLPVETDFEDEAEAQITADNFMQELDSLEKEITAGE